MPYIATINVPGYLPTDDDPPTFDTAQEAWRYLYHERCWGEMNAPCDLCDDTMSHGPMGDCDDDSETGRELAAAARESENTAPGAVEVGWDKTYYSNTGTVYGPTPGYDGQHDLGLAYSVTYADEEA